MININIIAVQHGNFRVFRLCCGYLMCKFTHMLHGNFIGSGTIVMWLAPVLINQNQPCKGIMDVYKYHTILMAWVKFNPGMDK